MALLIRYGYIALMEVVVVTVYGIPTVFAVVAVCDDRAMHYLVHFV